MTKPSAARASTSRRRAQKTSKPSPYSRDPHWLYQESVQSPEVHFGFFDRAYREQNGRAPLTLKEDFCGTALLAGRWVEHRRQNRALGVDLDAPTLHWGMRNNIDVLTDQQRARVTLRRANVLRVTRPAVDIIVALNFSYFIFHTRDALRRYFETTRKSLAPGGIFIGDIFGGWDSQRPVIERTRHRGFTYLWEVERYDPVSNLGHFHIHFDFHDGGRIRRAFSYHWRVWTVAEILEILAEAGFHRVEMYWEGFDKRGDGNSVFRRVATAQNTAGWIAFFVASTRKKGA